MQCACAIFSSVACSAQHFLTLTHKRHNFREIFFENKMFRFSLQLLSKIFLIVAIIERDIIINVLCIYVITCCSCQIVTKLEFSRKIFEKKNLKYQISRKSVQWQPSCCVQEDRRTDGHIGRHTEANIRFSKFCERAYKLNT